MKKYGLFDYAKDHPVKELKKPDGVCEDRPRHCDSDGWCEFCEHYDDGVCRIDPSIPWWY